MSRVAIAGASGFVGKALVRALLGKHEPIAISRGGSAVPPGATHLPCNLFNLKEAEHALEGADVAVYLVHSMLPAARLMQGDFADFDLLAADNFARAAARAGVRHLVYLGGLLPDVPESRLSHHLASRLEVERALASRGVPLTTIRAGLVIGRGGSSFEMMRKLVERLPIMIGPRWTRSRTQPVALEDVVAVLAYAIEHPELAGVAYDVGCPEVVTYADLLRLTGEAVGRRVRLVTVPIQTMNVSLAWVSVFGDASPALVRPLVQSLAHDLVARESLTLQTRAGVTPTPLREALRRAVTPITPSSDEGAASGTGLGGSGSRAAGDASLRSEPAPAEARKAASVCSVQRLPLPVRRDAGWVAAEYARWLPRVAAGLLRVEQGEDGGLRFFLLARRPLLELSPAPTRSTRDRTLFYVVGGLLMGQQTGKARARLEFREVLGRRFVLAAVQDYPPRLPWLIYSLTQALFHRWVMARFGRHLGRALPPSGQARSGSNPEP